jgi:hypothetical protein
MNRTILLESALRAEAALIAEAQQLLSDYLRPYGPSREVVVNRLLALLDGPQQREVQRLLVEALGNDTSNVA